MGWTDDLKQAVSKPETDDPGPYPPTWQHCRAPDSHYQTDVNKGSINMDRWRGRLNEWYKRGYRLAHVFEQDGNTVMVFEHAYH